METTEVKCPFCGTENEVKMSHGAHDLCGGDRPSGCGAGYKVYDPQKQNAAWALKWLANDLTLGVYQDDEEHLLFTASRLEARDIPGARFSVVFGRINAPTAAEIKTAKEARKLETPPERAFKNAATLIKSLAAPGIPGFVIARAADALVKESLAAHGHALDWIVKRNLPVDEALIAELKGKGEAEGK